MFRFPKIIICVKKEVSQITALNFHIISETGNVLNSTEISTSGIEPRNFDPYSTTSSPEHPEEKYKFLHWLPPGSLKNAQ